MKDAQADLLTICIPTYNRCEFLDYGVRKMAPAVQKYGVKILICDNASPDDTMRIGEKLQQDFSNVTYVRNERNIGPDRNFEKILKLSTSQYAWLFSDDDAVNFDMLPKIIAALQRERPQLLVLNSASRVNNISSKRYTNASQLLEEIGWHMQLISCLVFSRSLIQMADFAKYRDTNFIQFGIIFEAIARIERVSVYFLSDFVLLPFPEENNFHRAQGDGWFKDALPIFVDRWSQVILSLPACYTDNAKRSCIYKHGVNSGLFKLKGLVKLSLLGGLTPGKLSKTHYFHYAIIYPYVLVFLISLLPEIQEDSKLWRVLKVIGNVFRSDKD